MKLDRLLGERFKERPSDCVVDSHALMVRGGYMKYVANGIYSQYTPLKRVTKKIETIIREEMDAIDGQEVLFPVVLPASLWEESGRFSSVGSELVRLSDRNQSQLVLGMTHEEAAVQLARECAKSYTKYPFMIYQIQTKFRDEARPRAGLIRVREFTMKDAYSFHTSQEDLEQYYKVCYDAYFRIFKRAGLPEVVSVASDSGMMGGNLSHEYMLLSPIGEDSIVICKECGYKANMEAAECIVEEVENIAESTGVSLETKENIVGNIEVSERKIKQGNSVEKEMNSIEKEMSSVERTGEKAGLKLVNTPDQHTIEEVCGFLQTKVEAACKAVVYQKNMTDEYVVVFLRGDLEINETKLTNYLSSEIHPAVITPESGIVAGFIGPVLFTCKEACTVLYDRSLAHASGLVCGANRDGYHYTGLDIQRDCSGVEFHDFAKVVEGGICPVCGRHRLSISRGIEVGNIFQLGTKYTKTMNMQFQDQNGNLQHPVMGCYGIGVGRLAASICELHHDEFGPIWPMAVAPWQVHLCCLRADDVETKAAADDIYQKLTKAHLEVIYDDREVRPGVMFSDADLLGIPIRVIMSPRNLKEGCVEVVTRDKSLQRKIELSSAVSEIKILVEELLH